MGVMLRTPDGRAHYASGTFTKEIETVDEQNLTALLIAWQGGDGTIRNISAEQWADNKFGTPVEWFVNVLSAANAAAQAASTAAQAAAAAANAAKAAADQAAAAANANQAGIAAAKTAADDAKTAAVLAAAEAKAAHDAVDALDTGGGTGGGPVTIEVFAGLPGETALKLGSVDV